IRTYICTKNKNLIFCVYYVIGRPRKIDNDIADAIVDHTRENPKSSTPKNLKRKLPDIIEDMKNHNKKKKHNNNNDDDDDNADDDDDDDVDNYKDNVYIDTPHVSARTIRR